MYFPLKLANGRMSKKKKRICLYIIYNIVSLGKIAGKPEGAIEKICCYF